MSVISAQDGEAIQPISVARVVMAGILLSVAVRLVVASRVPLAFDEALYWRYSKHLAAGYLDHPFMNPMMIRLGTSLFGDTPLGVRFFTVVLGIPASWAVWRAGATLYRDERVGAIAAVFFNVTIVMTVGSMLATSDQVVVVASSFLLLALSKVNETGRGEWWLAVGLAFGLGMCSKYTTAFFAVSVFAWLLIVTENRRWFLSPWPWAGALIALAVFLPVLLWNAHHAWASVIYQGSRMTVHALTLRYFGEMVASQFGLATPPVFILACLSFGWGFHQPGENRAANILVGSLILPVVIYFAWHSLHQRVQGNWPEAMYPAVAVAAAFAAHTLSGRSDLVGRVATWSAYVAVPLGVVLATAVYAQALFGIVPLGRADPTSRMLGYGWDELASQIDEVRIRENAPVIVGTEYQVVSWLMFYLPSHAPTVQLTQRLRWSNEPIPDAQLFTGPMLYVCKNVCGKLAPLKQRFGEVVSLGALTRMRGGSSIERYELYRLSDPKSAVLDPPNAELTGEQLQ